jgi:hypothetical protein
LYAISKLRASLNNPSEKIMITCWRYWRRRTGDTEAEKEEEYGRREIGNDEEKVLRLRRRRHMEDERLENIKRRCSGWEKEEYGRRG